MAVYADSDEESTPAKAEIQEEEVEEEEKKSTKRTKEVKSGAMYVEFDSAEL